MSDATQHTPGPWQIERDITGFVITYQRDELRSHIARIYCGALCPEHGSSHANAELIALAPSLLAQRDALLAALEFMLRVGPSGIIGQQTAREHAIAAIALAGGGK